MQEGHGHDTQYLAYQIMSAAGQGVIISSYIDRKWILEYVNPAFCSLLGRSAEDLTGTSMEDLISPDDLPKLRQGRESRLDGETTSYEVRLKRSDGEVVYVQITGAPRWSEDKITGSIIVVTDLTEHKKHEEAMHAERLRFQTLSDNAPFGLFTVEKDGTFSYINPKFRELFGYDLKDVPNGREWFRIAFPDPEYRHQVISAWIRDSEHLGPGEKRPRTFTVTRKDGTEKITNFIAVELENGQNLVTCEDITERKRAEEALQESEAKFRNLFERSSDAMCLLDGEKFTDCNNAAMEMMKCSTKEELLNIHPSQLSPERQPDGSLSYEKAEEMMEEAFKKGSHRFEWIHRRTNGEEFPVEVTLTKVPWKGEQILYTIIKDITKRKKAEGALRDSERRLRDIIDFLPDAIFVIDNEGKVIAWNRAIETMTKVKAEDILGKGDYEYSVPFYGERRPALADLVLRPQEEIEKKYARVERKGATLIGESYMPNLGSEAYLWAAAAALYDAKGNIIGAIESIRDITDRKLAEKKLTASLQEKEVLLKEIHHRVKNNLQIVSSLLNVQAHYVQDENIAEVLEECRNRVRSMALIHESLYRSENLAKVDFARYISSLTTSLFSSFGADRRRIKLDLDLEKVFLSIDRAISCGLIVNELISNCLKHAFPGQEAGKVQIKLQCLDTAKVMLIVRDNGIGLQDAPESQKTQTMGLKLVTDLVKQLKGNLQIRNKDGVEFKIVFAAD